MLRVAICDDEPNLLAAMKACIKNALEIERFFCEIQCFSNGKTMLEAYRAFPFNILFLDICMPDIDGFELARIIRKMNYETFLIFVTAQDTLEPVDTNVEM